MSKTFGYCRISTVKQNLPRQIDNIKAEYPDAIIITEEFTGTKINRPAFDKLLKAIKPGDTIVFDEVSRMSRDAEEGFKLYEELYNKGVNLIFLKEPYVNTSVFRNNLSKRIELMSGTGNKAMDKLLDTFIKGLNEYTIDIAKDQIRIAFEEAQKEVEYLHKRTSEGVRKANERYDREAALGLPHTKNRSGFVKGTKLTTKKSIEMKAKIKALSKDFDGANTDKEVMAITKLARNTYYKYKRELVEEKAAEQN